MGPFTPHPQDSTVYTLAAQMMADAANDGDRARIDKAIDLVATVERTARPGVWLVRSASEEDRAYTVLGRSCSCADYKRRGACCKHYYAVQLFQQAERAEVDAEQRLPIAGGCELLPRPTRQELEAQMDPATLLFACDQCGIRTNHVAMVGLARGGSIALCLTCQRPPITGGRAPLTVRVDPEDSILDLWPVPDGEPCAIDSTQTGRRITVLPYTPAQAAIASELYADEPQGAA